MHIKNSSFLSRRCFQELKHLTHQSSGNEAPVIINDIADKTIVILNRPQSLNAINSSVLYELNKTLHKIDKQKSLVILKGTGNRAFSAGGDLLEIYHADKISRLKQYAQDLNICLYRIFNSTTPIIVFMNGITFGAGAGIASLVKYKIATEKTAFAMPEVKIGFHPNAAGTYFLNRISGKLGYYLGLTGVSLKGSDVCAAGIATHYCLSDKLPQLEKALLSSNKNDDIKEILDNQCEKDIPTFSLSPIMEKIDKYFSEPTVEGIISKLQEDESEWAKNVLKGIHQSSPTALKVILKQLQRGKNWSLEACLVMERNLSVNFYKFPDCLEGTKSVLLNKGNLPKWNPDKLADVTEQFIESHFEPVEEDPPK